MGGSAAHSRLCLGAMLPRDIIAEGDAFDVGPDADLAGKALQGIPAGAVAHQLEVKTELERNALAGILPVEGGTEGVIGPVLERDRFARSFEAAGMTEIEIVVHGDHRP